MELRISSMFKKVPRCGKCCLKILQKVGNSCRSNYCTDSLNLKSHSYIRIVDDAEVEVTFSNGNVMNIGSKKLASLADGSATVTLHDTTVLATVMSKETSSGPLFTPLTVSYRQKAAALGRIPLTFIRRELGSSEDEILTSRMIDRSVRPLFREGFTWETQLICYPLALDGTNFPDVLSVNAASAALAVSDVPWCGPIGAVRVGLVNKEVVINPSKRELIDSTLNLVVAALSHKLIVMIEGTADNILIQDFFKSLKYGAKECQKIVMGIRALASICGKKKRHFEPFVIPSELMDKVESLSLCKLKEIFQNFSLNKTSRDDAVSSLRQEVLVSLKDDSCCTSEAVTQQAFDKVCRKAFRDSLFESGFRCDGRKTDELREITSSVDLYKPLHGSALFKRGQTQVMCTVALDSPNSALKMDRVTILTSGLKEKNFFVHYEFPPFSTREIGRVGFVGRREVGHGALAEKALKSNIPHNFPFTIRLTSEVLESNGSSSMATVCGGSLALLDAGVPLENPVAGVAMGLVVKNQNSEVDAEADGDDGDDSQASDFKILTDLSGIEDHFGDMDFKIAGTKKALTAFQMDIKTRGVPMKLVVDIVNQSRSATAEILKKMSSVCQMVRTSRKSCWPEIKKLTVPPQSRWKFLGPGKANVKRIEMEFGVEITELNLGEFEIFATNKEALNEAEEEIRTILKSLEEPQLEFGGVYSATIREIKDSGCMVTLYPNMHPVLIQTSQLDKKKVYHPSALGLEVGQVIQVKYFGRDPISGTMRLSRKVLQGVTSEVVQNLVKRETTEEESQSTDFSVEKEN